MNRKRPNFEAAGTLSLSGYVTMSGELCEEKIRNAQCPPSVNKKIREFYVLMNDLLLMSILKSIRSLFKYQCNKVE